ncbi:p21-C-terminal region-binding protein-domain-containing protein [Lipomyces japonicus]|uniref:p21-C-terminal region-binding protein-domain-containing protein n=1 Tax=Lipomyces japonicus TaxID=56871 RepID=UPI0034CFD501
MAKRKDEQKRDPAPVNSEEENQESGDDEEIVNVDFDFFDPRPDIDFQAYKNLLRQTFDADNTLFDLSALADLILSQSSIGSTVKTDGIESDPFAFLSVINVNANINKQPIQQVRDYLFNKTKKSEAFNTKLRALLGDDATTTKTGIIFSERLINMPIEVVPPMYKMLVDEMQRAIENDEPFKFDYYLIISKSFTEIASKLDDEDEQPKKKKKSAKQSKEIFYFHAEDEIIQRRSEYYLQYKFTKQGQEADSKRTFQDYGISPQGQLMLIDAKNFTEFVEEIGSLFAVPPQ